MTRKKTTEEFSKEANMTHNWKYDYSKCAYIGAHKKICIACPTHGEFWQTPHEHLKGYGCPKCSGKHRRTKEEWVAEANKIHNGKYNYSKTEYNGNREKVLIVCPNHGEFWQIASDHLNGFGCPKCTKKYHYTTEEWIEAAKKVHGGKYDYSKSKYINSKSKICIICPKHGEFWQNASHHLGGIGCPMCGNISKLENETKRIFDEQNIGYEQQKHFMWLGLQTLDFYLPKYNIGIECQGMQHFEEREHFDGLDKIKERDNRKLKLCLENNIKLYYINYFDNVNDRINKIINSLNFDNGGN